VRHRHGKPPERKATGSDQVYTWDITYMSRTIKGFFYYAYVVKDLYDRSIVGWAVHEEESEKHSKVMFENILKAARYSLKRCMPITAIR
jgi:transposase InsO family protein